MRRCKRRCREEPSRSKDSGLETPWLGLLIDRLWQWTMNVGYCAFRESCRMDDVFLEALIAS